MKKIIIIVSIIIVLIGIYFAYQGIFGQKEPDYTTVLVSKGEVVQDVSVTGTVISARQIDLQFENSGKIKTIEKEVGDSVLAGQVLMRLDTAELNAQLRANQAALEIAQAKLAQTLAGARSEDIQVYQSAVDKAEVDVENKKQALIDVQTDADNDLNEAYQDALDAVKTAYTVSHQALLITFAEIRQNYFNSSSQLAFNVRDKESIAKNDLSSAENYLDIAEANSTYDNIDTALSKMKIAVDSIRDALSYFRSALDDPSISGSVSSTDETNIDTERSNIDSELVNLTSSEQKIDSTEIDNQTNINTAQANLETAEAALEKSRDELALKEAGPRQVDIDLAEAEVRQAQANVLQMMEKINKAILKAPVDGVITAVEKEPGEIAQANSVVISMINTGRFQVEVNVSETEIAKVKLGNKVLMTLDALGPDEEFTGQIIKIDPAETVISGVIYYKATSVFDTEDERIKSGMTVNLDIRTDAKENVLYLPYYVIKERNGEKYVLVLEDGEITERVVKTGLEGETRVEILEGVEQGESVVMER